MICPKCRKIYTDSVEICPDCQVDLIGFLGDADAPDDNAKMERIVIDNNGEIAPTVVYRAVEEPLPVNNGLPIMLLVLSAVMLAASGFCFVLGKSGGAQAAEISSFISNFLI